MGLIYEQPVYTQLLKSHHIVLAALGLELFQSEMCIRDRPVSFFRSNLAGAEGLAYMIGYHIICATHSSSSGNVLPLCQKELRIRSPAVTRIAGNELAVICFLWIGYLVDDVTDCPTFCATLANMKRHASCSCHNRRPSSHKYFFADVSKRQSSFPMASRRPSPSRLKPAQQTIRQMPG